MNWQRQATGWTRALRLTAGACTLGLATIASAQVPALETTAKDLPRLRLDSAEFSARLPSTAHLGALAAVDPAMRVRPDSRGFYQGFFLPRMTHQFDRMRAYGDVPTSGQALSEFVLLDEVTGAAQKRAEKGLSRSLRTYLLETTTIGRWIDSFGDDAIRTATGGRERSDERRFRTGFGIAHGLPRVDMRYPLGHTTLRLGVGADRTVGLEMRRSTATSAAVSAKYDWADRSYTFGCRIAF